MTQSSDSDPVANIKAMLFRPLNAMWLAVALCLVVATATLGRMSGSKVTRFGRATTSLTPVRPHRFFAKRLGNSVDSNSVDSNSVDSGSAPAAANQLDPANPYPQCDWECYHERYHDLVTAYGQYASTKDEVLKSHYRDHGISEKRDCTCAWHKRIQPKAVGGMKHYYGCNWGCYADRYSDVMEVMEGDFAKVKAHWFSHGSPEGRDCTCKDNPTVEKIDGYKPKSCAPDDATLVFTNTDADSGEDGQCDVKREHFPTLGQLDIESGSKDVGACLIGWGFWNERVEAAPARGQDKRWIPEEDRMPYGTCCCKSNCCWDRCEADVYKTLQTGECDLYLASWQLMKTKGFYRLKWD